ncbi:MAG TPA: hypothetical protein VFC63_29140 [Blastocatellia bacterium]|nr:hypothetical protein [Blastocatellia bacterium]
MSKDRISGNTIIMLVIAWLWVGIPLVWGIYQTYLKSVALFK